MGTIMVALLAFPACNAMQITKQQPKNEKAIEANWAEALENHIRTHLELTADADDPTLPFHEPGEWCHHLAWSHENDQWEEWQRVPEIRWW